MAATDELPRGWIHTDLTDGSAASIAIPAVPGVSHVIDGIYAKLSFSAILGPYQVELTSAVTWAGGLTVANLYLPAAGSDDATLSGLGLTGLPGEVLTVKFNSFAAGVFEMLIVQGHDI